MMTQTGRNGRPKPSGSIIFQCSHSHGGVRIVAQAEPQALDQGAAVGAHGARILDPDVVVLRPEAPLLQAAAQAVNISATRPGAAALKARTVACSGSGNKQQPKCLLAACARTLHDGQRQAHYARTLLYAPDR